MCSGVRKWTACSVTFIAASAAAAISSTRRTRRGGSRATPDRAARAVASAKSNVRATRSMVQ
jgi:hypothetical protein